MDETDETRVPTVGERLRAAREEKGLALEDIAAQTRIPRRHLESIETSEWDKLPAPTYTVGFAKSFATAVGLDRVEIGDRLREEMGGSRTTAAEMEIYEAADPARTMPKWLVLAAIVAVIAVVIALTWYNRQALQPDEAPATSAAPAAEQPAAQPTQQQSQQLTAQGPVVLAASEPVWIQIKNQGRTLFEGTLNPGQNFQVPATATAPLLKAGKPEALRVTVGTAIAPPIGPPGQVASDVSLIPADLMGRPAPASPAPGTQPQPAAP